MSLVFQIFTLIHCSDSEVSESEIKKRIPHYLVDANLEIMKNEKLIEKYQSPTGSFCWRLVD